MNLGLYGYGGHAREVAAQINQKVTFFVDDQYVDANTQPISTFDPENYLMMVAVADPNLRQLLVNKLPNTTKFFTFIHPTSLILGSDVEVEEGSFIGANSILTTNIKIGKHAVLNRYVQIGHDVSIGDYFSAMPGAVVSGNVTIYDLVYAGTNSSIKEKLSIHSSTIIGSNAAVVSNIKKPGVYVGVPARLKQNTDITI